MPEDTPDGVSIIEIIVEDDATTTLVIDPGDNRQLARFHPGQFATIRLMEDSGWSAPHPFTLSGAPGDPLRVTIRSRGAFTSGTVPQLRPGDAIKCAGPYGVFCRDIAYRDDIVLIAGGMGITPFLSVLRHFAHTEAQNRIVLFWCNRTYAAAFAAAELEELARKLRLRIVHVLSRENNPDIYSDPAEPQVFFEKGHLDRAMLTRHMHASTASFYLCAPKDMRNNVLEELSACGIDPGCVETEEFDFG